MSRVNYNDDIPYLIGGIGKKKSNDCTQWYQQNRVYDASHIAMCLPAQLPSGSYYYLIGGEKLDFIKIKQATSKGYDEAEVGDSVDFTYPNSQTRRGIVGHGVCQSLTTSGGDHIGVVTDEGVFPINPEPDGTCRTIKSQYAKTSLANFQRSASFGATGVSNNLKIRKLTPRECWRLQGFSDRSFDKASSVCSNSQLYHQAGNSITVDVLVYMFNALGIVYQEFKSPLGQICEKQYEYYDEEFGESQINIFEAIENAEREI